MRLGPTLEERILLRIAARPRVTTAALHREFGVRSAAMDKLRRAGLIRTERGPRNTTQHVATAFGLRTADWLRRRPSR